MPHPRGAMCQYTSMATELPERLEDLVPLQRGVVARQQALADGMTRHAVTARLESRRWQKLHDGVYYTYTGPVPREARLWAAVLRVGHGAVLSHETAAELWGFADRRSPVIHVSVPRQAGTLTVPEVRLHYSARLPDARCPSAPVPVTRREDTVLDLVNSAASDAEAVAWLAAACQRGTATPGSLREYLGKPGRARMRWRGVLLGTLRQLEAGATAGETGVSPSAVPLVPLVPPQR
jgi:hypothetical protein